MGVDSRTDYCITGTFQPPNTRYDALLSIEIIERSVIFMYDRTSACSIIETAWRKLFIYFQRKSKIEIHYLRHMQLSCSMLRGQNTKDYFAGANHWFSNRMVLGNSERWTIRTMLDNSALGRKKLLGADQMWLQDSVLRIVHMQKK